MKFGMRELVFLLIILGVLGSSYFYLNRKNEERQAIQERRENNQRELAELQRSMPDVTALGQRIDDLEKAIGFFEAKLPNSKEVAKVLKQIEDLAIENNLTVKTVKPLNAERTASYTETPMELSFTGQFKPGFYRFLQEVEKLPRITRISKMSLMSIPGIESPMQAHVTLSIFSQPDGVAAAQ